MLNICGRDKNDSNPTGFKQPILESRAKKSNSYTTIGEIQMNHTDIQFHTIIERLDRIEKKIDNRLNKTWFTIADVVLFTGLSKSTINRAIRIGYLKSVKNGGKRMYKREWVDRWISGE